MKKILVLIVSILLYNACSTTQLVRHEQSTYDELNQQLEKKEVNIVLNNDEKLTSSEVCLGLDSSCVDGILIPTKSINKISSTNSAVGFITGAAGGAICGAAIGYVFGSATSSGDNPSFNPLKILFPDWTGQGEQIRSGITIGAAIGFIGGGALGTMTGPEHTLIIHPSEKESSVVYELHSTDEE